MNLGIIDNPRENIQLNLTIVYSCDWTVFPFLQIRWSANIVKECEFHYKKNKCHTEPTWYPNFPYDSFIHMVYGWVVKPVNEVNLFVFVGGRKRVGLQNTI